MNRDKQIDEMTKDLCHTEACEIKKIGIPCNHRCKAHIYATRAIDKGYRKASEVVWEIFEEIEKMLLNNHIGHYKTVKDTWSYNFNNEILAEIAELKKKYTEGGK